MPASSPNIRTTRSTPASRFSASATCSCVQARCRSNSTRWSSASTCEGEAEARRRRAQPALRYRARDGPLGRGQLRRAHGRERSDRSAFGRADPFRLRGLGLRRHLGREHAIARRELLTCSTTTRTRSSRIRWHAPASRTDAPVCVMNAGYSSGWCEASFGVPLVAVEILCRAKGDERCRFIMAPPDAHRGLHSGVLR